MISKITYLTSFLLLAAAPLSGTADVKLTDEQKAELEKWVAGRIVGEPQKCIYRAKSNDIVVISEQVFLFGSSRRSKTIYINKVSGACTDAGKYTMVFRRTSAARLCRGDIVVVVDAVMNMPRGSCRLNDFVALKRAKK